MSQADQDTNAENPSSNVNGRGPMRPLHDPNAPANGALAQAAPGSTQPGDRTEVQKRDC